MCMSFFVFVFVLFLTACTYVYHVPAWYIQRSEEGVRSPGTSVKSDGKPMCIVWELNPDPLREQQVRSTAQPCLQPRCSVFCWLV